MASSGLLIWGADADLVSLVSRASSRSSSSKGSELMEVRDAWTPLGKLRLLSVCPPSRESLCGACLRSSGRGTSRSLGAPGARPRASDQATELGSLSMPESETKEDDLLMTRESTDPSSGSSGGALASGGSLRVELSGPPGSLGKGFRLSSSVLASWSAPFPGVRESWSGVLSQETVG